MAEEWKEKIIKDKLGGKRDWTDEERAKLCQQLDEDLDHQLDNMSKSKYEGGWTEENWRQEMAEHPLFAPYVQDEGTTEAEAPINPLSEGLAQLKFDPEHNTPQEVAQSYKEEGILQFKYKKYRLAIANFSEGLKQNFQDCELKAQLYNNRAAANWHLENYRSAMKDCEKAVEFKPDYMKALVRAVDSGIKLRAWDQVFCWCDRGLKLDPTNHKLKNDRLLAVREKKLEQRNARKKAQEEKKKKTEEEVLLQAIQGCGVQLGSPSITLADLEPCHPAAQSSRVHLNDRGELVWPVMLLYPEHQETDVIQQFNENDRMIEQLEVVFGPQNPPAPWDTEHKYQLHNLCVFFEDREKGKLVAVDPTNTLRQVITDHRYRVLGGTPGFFILAKNSKFMQSFVTRYS